MTGTESASEGREGDAPRPSPHRAPLHAIGNYGSPTGLLVKLVLLALLNAVVLWGLTVMASAGEWTFLVVSAVALVVIDYVYLSKRTVPAKYLVPGTVFLLVFAVYPVLYTIYISTTNYGTGNNLSQEQAIDQIQRQSITATDDATRYSLQILAERNPGGELAFLLTDPDGDRFLGTADGLTPLDESDIVADGRRETIAGFVPLNAGQSQDRVAEIRAFAVPGPEGEIDNDGFGAAFTKLQRYVYDPATGTMIDNVADVVFTVEGGYFVNDDEGRRLLPGWRTNVGLANYEQLFTDPTLRNNFLRVFAWTVIFAGASVFFSFSLGLLLALVFNNPKMRGRQFYRSLIIIPYALPSFMTALVWRGMFNQSFGVINRWLDISLPWLSGQWLPYVSILIVNTWLGYVYMFLVTSGALQSIPDDLTEAAKVDGANGPMRFRRITLPLLLVSVSPLLIASFAFNFNNFNLIYLLTEGRPSIPGSDAGRTDILITFTYKVAFEQGARADYGFASALAVVIFVIVALISAVSFRYTKQLEEIR